MAQAELKVGLNLWGGNMALRVYLANENEIVKEGLKSVIAKNSSLNVIGEYSGMGDFFFGIERAKPNLIFIDVTSLELKLLNNIKKIKERYPKLLIAAIIYKNDKEIIDELINLNINGIFFINLKIEELIKGLSEIAVRAFYIQSNILYKIEKENNTNLIKSDKYKINSLTKREMEVLIQVANGMFNKEIAIALNISERTVKNHMSNIFKKIEVSDRTQAAVFAIKNKIIHI